MLAHALPNRAVSTSAMALALALTVAMGGDGEALERFAIPARPPVGPGGSGPTAAAP